ncbi:MAG: hypothetical protein IJ077_01895, partial [Eubacterium sp.]|nr:hypothetical protein [Eubacterium sp.]
YIFFSLLICAVICIAAVFIGERITFGDFTVIRHYINLRGINFVPDEILGALASALVLGVVANALFCKKLISKFAPEDKKTYFTEK